MKIISIIGVRLHFIRWNVLTGSSEKKIMKMVYNFEPDGEQRHVFGDGDASEKIIKIISKKHEKGGNPRNLR
jgi:UDP-N-acetylglucosamine 2-epimerase